MAYCFNAANGYNEICDEFDNGSVRTSLGRHRMHCQWVWKWGSARKAHLCRASGMDDVDGLLLGCCRRISWRHLFWKIKADWRNMIKPRSASHMRFKYDSLSYALNFDNGRNYQDDPDYAQHSICSLAAKTVPVGRYPRHVLSVQIHMLLFIIF